VFEFTWSFGWRGRDAATAWRCRLRDEALLAPLEEALASALDDGGSSAVEVRVLPASAPGGSVFIALLDDEPHASLDKKRGGGAPAPEKSSTDDADAALGKATGLAPAVAHRLQVVLRLCAAAVRTNEDDSAEEVHRQSRHSAALEAMTVAEAAA
jgi:hypothetical protein